MIDAEINDEHIIHNGRMHSSKSYPQPPPNERLLSSKIFLACEDSESCLQFASKLKQIEDYIQHVDQSHIPDIDPKLYRDVKAMLEAHRDWKVYNAQESRDTNCIEGTIIQPFSSRLLSAENAAIWESQKEKQDIVAQMREDQAPVPVQGAAGYNDFMWRLREQAKSGEVRPEESLLFADSKAYEEALKEPALISNWTHPTYGTPKIGTTHIGSPRRIQISTNSASKSPRVGVDQMGPTHREAADFITHAERHGVQRAAIELALNSLATNQEQHRPSDPFRIVSLPETYQSPVPEVQLHLPLEPFDTPMELDTFKFTKSISSYRDIKDFDYFTTCQASPSYGLLKAPINYKGPFSLPDINHLQELARSRLSRLIQLMAAMAKAEQQASRPLIQQMLLRTSEGFDSDPNVDIQEHRLYDEEVLSDSQMELLLEIAGPSWSLAIRPYPKRVPHLVNQYSDRMRLEAFERDVSALEELPIWISSRATTAGITVDPDDPLRFIQRPHDSKTPSLYRNPSNGTLTAHGLTLSTLLQSINNKRLAKRDSSDAPRTWRAGESLRYLHAMKSAGRIHIDKHVSRNPLDYMISRIPLDGHPENKYVLSAESVEFSPGVYFNTQYQLEVQYDAYGKVGPPIVQPNKYHYLQRLSFRLGRDILECTQVLAGATLVSPTERLQKQWKSILAVEDKMRNISFAVHQDLLSKDTAYQQTRTLQDMARDLHLIAPDLAGEAGFNFRGDIKNMTTTEAACILQMQILEEASNNWESRLPHDEHVWDFAEPRLKPMKEAFDGCNVQGTPNLTRFFDMRHFPTCFQSTATESDSKPTGPTLLEPPAPVTTAKVETVQAPQIKVRYIKGRKPYFPFGETPYQAAYLSWRMEQDLKAVKECQVNPPRSSIFSRKRKRGNDRPVNRHALPQIPDNWHPTNISAEKGVEILGTANV